MAHSGVRTTRPRTPTARGSRGGFRGSHVQSSSQPGRHLAIQKTGGKLRSLKNQIRGVQRLLEKVIKAPCMLADSELH